METHRKGQSVLGQSEQGGGGNCDRPGGSISIIYVKEDIPIKAFAD